MASNDPTCVDARNSIFNNVDGNQNNFHIDITVNLNRPHSRYTVGKDNDILMPTENGVSRIQCRRRQYSHNTHPGSPDNVLQWHSTCDAMDSLIVNIAQLLADRGETGDHNRRLELELELLRHTLALTNLAMQAYDRTLMGRNLVTLVVPEVNEICALLQILCNRIDHYRQGLWPTSIHDLWHTVWWGGCEVDDVLAKLAVHQRLLSRILMALNS